MRPSEAQELAAVLAIIVSWAIAFFEATLAVHANRFGSAVYRVAELKTIQEAITLIVFAVFSVTYLGEALKPTTIGLPFRLIAAFFICMDR